MSVTSTTMPGVVPQVTIGEIARGVDLDLGVEARALVGGQRSPALDRVIKSAGVPGRPRDVLEVANRFRVGPMHDCAECKFEEFFLSSWAVGDPAMVVDVPANAPVHRSRPQIQGGDLELRADARAARPPRRSSRTIRRTSTTAT